MFLSKPIYVVAIIRRGGFLRNIPQQNWVPRTFGMKKGKKENMASFYFA
jgi:hypothetical protein